MLSTRKLIRNNMRIGVRVVRGVDWKWAEQDGGEGFVGTVVDLPVTAPKTAQVQWDVKPAMNYRAGYCNQYDLRVFDSAPSGIKHPFPCNGKCHDQEIFGVMWKCTICPNIHLCTTCYMDDKHNIEHPFAHRVAPEAQFVPVPPRQNSKKICSYGIFRDAIVIRGKDWMWNDQDGGIPSEGRIFQTQGWQEESRRSVVRVEWRKNKASNVYRVGHRGKADLLATSPSKGWAFYVEHLPNFGDDGSGVRVPMFSVGERVKIDDNLERVKNLAENHGGWHHSMQQYLGKAGSVHRITDRSDVRVLFDSSQKWTYNAKVLTKVFSQGESVMITQDVETLTDFHGDELSVFLPLSGKSGKILNVPIGPSSLYVVKIDFDQIQNTVRHIHANCLYLMDESEASVNVLMEVEPVVSQTSVVTAASSTRFLDDLVQSNKVDAAPLVVEPSDKDIREFFAAIDAGQEDVVKSFLKKTPKLIECRLDEEYPLFRAVAKNQTRILNIFPQFNVDIFGLDASGDTALHAAVRNTSTEVLQVLTRTYWLRLMEKPNAESLTPLHLAVKLGKTDFVRILIQTPGGPICAKTRNEDGDLPLHTAVAFGHQSMVDLLLSFRSVIDPSLPNEEGQNALHYACIHGRDSVVAKILATNPELTNVHNRRGFGPLHLSVFHDKPQCIEHFLRHGTICNRNARVSKNVEFISFTSLHLAVKKILPHIVERLIESGSVDVNLTEDTKLSTPLHLAVECLIEKGCDLASDRVLQLQQEAVSGTNLKMGRLLQLCNSCAPLAICCYLLMNGANPTLKNKSGSTPLDILMSNSSFKVYVAVLKSFTNVAHLGQSNVAPTAKISSPSRLRPNDVEGDMCNLCGDVKANVRYEPCNHMLYCLACTHHVAAKIKKCGRCNTDVVAKVGPHGEIKPKPNNGEATHSEGHVCIICFESPKNWIVPKCGHALCRSCAMNVKECPSCRQPMMDLRQLSEVNMNLDCSCLMNSFRYLNLADRLNVESVCSNWRRASMLVGFPQNLVLRIYFDADVQIDRSGVATITLAGLKFHRWFPTNFNEAESNAQLEACLTFFRNLFERYADLIGAVVLGGTTKSTLRYPLPDVDYCSSVTAVLVPQFMQLLYESCSNLNALSLKVVSLRPGCLPLLSAAGLGSRLVQMCFDEVFWGYEQDELDIWNNNVPSCHKLAFCTSSSYLLSSFATSLESRDEWLDELHLYSRAQDFVICDTLDENFSSIFARSRQVTLVLDIRECPLVSSSLTAALSECFRMGNICRLDLLIRRGLVSTDLYECLIFLENKLVELKLRSFENEDTKSSNYVLNDDTFASIIGLLGSCPKLKCLFLTRCSRGVSNFEPIYSLPSLETFGLDGAPKFNEANLTFFVTQCEQLKRLALFNCPMIGSYSLNRILYLTSSLVALEVVFCGELQRGFAYGLLQRNCATLQFCHLKGNLFWPNVVRQKFLEVFPATTFNKKFEVRIFLEEKSHLAWKDVNSLISVYDVCDFCNLPFNR